VTALPLSHYENDTLATMSAPDLLGLLVHDEDRAPRNVIDECARRGETMVELLRDVLAQGRGWDNDDDSENDIGEWWLLHHAMMILEFGVRLVAISICALFHSPRGFGCVPNATAACARIAGNLGPDPRSSAMLCCRASIELR
jgi:hypothetical protein